KRQSPRWRPRGSVDRKPWRIIGERNAESTPVATRVWSGSGAQPIDVRLRPLLMGERAILDVDDTIGEFEEPRVVRHYQDSAAVVSGDAGEDGHDGVAVDAVESRGWFIGQDRRRLGNNRAGDCDPLLFAARSNPVERP